MRRAPPWETGRLKKVAPSVKTPIGDINFHQINNNILLPYRAPPYQHSGAKRPPLDKSQNNGLDLREDRSKQRLHSASYSHPVPHSSRLQAISWRQVSKLLGLRPRIAPTPRVSHIPSLLVPASSMDSWLRRRSAIISTDGSFAHWPVSQGKYQYPESSGLSLLCWIYCNNPISVG